MCTFPLSILNPRNERAKRERDTIQVPCGQCIECRIQKSRHWALRCEHELLYHKTACFLTLTYNDENLVWGYQVPTLYPKHLEKFWKRLRKYFGVPGLRYYACGEYGDKRGRPHYHAILFGHDFIEDRQVQKECNGYRLYTSKILDKLWSHGQCIIGEVNFDAIAYCARYTLKKQTGRNSGVYKTLGIEPEFARMSRNPGIGSKFYEQYSVDLFPHDYAVTMDGVKLSVPPYYNNKFKQTNPGQYEDIVYNRLLKNDPLRNSEKRRNARNTIKHSKIKTFERDMSAFE